jgi:hypothetical protein
MELKQTLLNVAFGFGSPYRDSRREAERLSTPTHGQLSAAQASSTTVSRSDIRLIQHFALLGAWFGPEVALNWLIPYPLTTPPPPTRRARRSRWSSPGARRRVR